MARCDVRCVEDAEDDPDDEEGKADEEDDEGDDEGFRDSAPEAPLAQVDLEDLLHARSTPHDVRDANKRLLASHNH